MSIDSGGNYTLLYSICKRVGLGYNMREAECFRGNKEKWGIAYSKLQLVY